MAVSNLTDAGVKDILERIFVSKSAQTLYDYQQKSIADTYAAIRAGKKRVLIQVPTGGGKSTIISQIVKDYLRKRPNKQVLGTAHRNMLIDQLADRLGVFGIPSWSVYGGKIKTPNYPVQVASINTLARQKDNEWPPNVGLLFIDEAHRALADMYQAAIERYPNAILIGLTATPIRGDGRGLGDLFDELILGPSVKTLIEKERFCRYRIFEGTHVDTSKLDFAGDYNQKQLSEQSMDKKLLGDLVESWFKFAEGMQTITFAVDVQHSMAITARYQAAGVSAEHVDGNTPDEITRAVFRRFRNKETQVLVNVGIATEGIDLPECACVQLARATRSLGHYLQMVGRGARVFPGKNEFIILDHGNNRKENGLPDDDHEWSLEGVKKRPSQVKVLENGEVIKQEELTLDTPRVVIEDTTAVMVEVSQSWQSRIDEICFMAEAKSYQKQWAYHRTVEKFGRNLQVEHLKYLAKKLGYHWRWGIHQYEKWQTEREQNLREKYGTSF